MIPQGADRIWAITTLVAGIAALYLAIHLALLGFMMSLWLAPPPDIEVARDPGATMRSGVLIEFLAGLWLVGIGGTWLSERTVPRWERVLCIVLIVIVLSTAVASNALPR